MKQIEKGDRVEVHFNNVQYTLTLDAIVISIPVATGDSWIVEDLNNNQLHYISEGCTITKNNRN